MLKIANITKKYGKKTVLDNISFEIGDGQVCALLGLNGAGKSTLMKIICALAFATSGDIELDDVALNSDKQALASIGYMIEAPTFYNELTCEQNLVALAKLYDNIPKERVSEVLRLVGLSTQANIPVRKCSLGMKQRLYFAYAIMNNPRLLILDEPFNSVDPVSINLFKTLITDFAKGGSSVLISGHDIGEIQSVSDSAVILDNGKILYQDNDIKGKDLTKIFLSLVSASGDAQ